MICEHIFFIIFLNEPDLIFFNTVKNFEVFQSNTNK